MNGFAKLQEFFKFLSGKENCSRRPNIDIYRAKSEVVIYILTLSCKSGKKDNAG
jgi:hypothetical protein